MKHLYLNLKRFDVPVEYGGVNRIAPLKDWGSYIVAHTQEGLKQYDPSQVEFVQYFPEAHILGAVERPMRGQPRPGGLPGRLPDEHRRGRQLRRLHHQPSRLCRHAPWAAPPPSSATARSATTRPASWPRPG